MPDFKHKPEPRIQDMERTPLQPYRGKFAPFDTDKELKAYNKAAWNCTNDKDIAKTRQFYMPTLYPCGCHNPWQDARYGEGLRSQYDCGGYYRCMTCGEERQSDGSKHIRRRVSAEDVKKEVKMENEQMSLLTWVEEKDVDD